MARVRYVGPEPVTVPELGRIVEPDEIVQVPDERFEGYACQLGTWEPIEEPKDETPPAAPVKKTAAKASQKTEG
ncbi:hypothetical protein [Streptomyces sp. NPDC059759]|uniref:hypothetical protein n=1 Tax=Streptomyces sp. NPDC059759 TaxID=3346936 RepID=UPI003668FF89